MPSKNISQKAVEKKQTTRGNSESFRLAELISYSMLGILSFAVLVAATYLIVNEAPLLVSLGLFDNFFFVMLFIMGICAAFFLFGVLKSYAIIKHSKTSTMGLVRGPAALFLIVLFGGKILLGSGKPFPVTAFVNYSSSKAPVKSHNINYQYGTISSSAPIADGKITISDISSYYRGTKIRFHLDDVDYAIEGKDTFLLNDQTIQLYIKRKVKQTKARGFIKSFSSPYEGIGDVKVKIGSDSTTTDSTGWFELPLIDSVGRSEYTLRYYKHGYRPESVIYIPETEPELPLKKQRD